MHNLPFPLVVAIDGELRASSDALSAGIGQAHASVIKLVRRHSESLERFGRVRFKIRPFATRGGNQSREVALLNEHQATLLIAMMRNSPRVIDFKVRLVEEFFRMRDELQVRTNDLWKQMQALIAKEVESKVRASFGSHLMNIRKKEIPPLRDKRYLLEQEIQPPLFLN
jgi:phage regulator Rha-like protein